MGEELHPDVLRVALALIQRNGYLPGESLVLTRGGHPPRRFVYAGGDTFIETTPEAIAAEWREVSGGR